MYPARFAGWKWKEETPMSKYFSPSEFKHCTPACDISKMNPAFLERLDALREFVGIPLVLNSAYRSKSYEKAHGRTGNSAHTRGLAVDIRCNASATRYRLVAGALVCGFKRIGIGKSYIHLDVDESLPQGVIWHYYGE